MLIPTEIAYPLNPSDDPNSEEEVARGRDKLAKRMLNTPPQPLKPKGDASQKKRGRLKNQVGKDG
ncbi:hypothetical protein MPC4_220053 [Methylocella tundrae]|uniref:Uncharacterized protein n=1 Tax=Methylocella tundrae TaxID=227605 RepID=A0A8B6M7N5_METTU|nr:hypothetical protein MPC4_220053 [Methylocella tundrae]